ncbi:hypothetical protein HK098_003282 [Nowakowskiella sp. JEL0407]|nr:hypothetical protein HK098_003282 [Nowakowskiella sp. JEL0407]
MNPTTITPSAATEIVENSVLLELGNRHGTASADTEEENVENSQMSNKEKRRLKFNRILSILLNILKITILLGILVLYVSASGAAAAVAGLNQLQYKFNETENFAPNVSKLLRTTQKEIAIHGAYFALFHSASWMIFVPIYLSISYYSTEYKVSQLRKVLLYLGCTVVLVLSYVFLNPLFASVYLGLPYDGLLHAFGIGFCYFILYSFCYVMLPLVGSCLCGFSVAEAFGYYYGVGIGAAGAAGAVAGLLLHPFTFVVYIAGFSFLVDIYKKRFQKT